MCSGAAFVVFSSGAAPRSVIGFSAAGGVALTTGAVAAGACAIPSESIAATAAVFIVSSILTGFTASTIPLNIAEAAVAALSMLGIFAITLPGNSLRVAPAAASP